jgi:hypothetical protein
VPELGCRYESKCDGTIPVCFDKQNTLTDWENGWWRERDGHAFGHPALLRTLAAATGVTKKSDLDGLSVTGDFTINLSMMAMVVAKVCNTSLNILEHTVPHRHVFYTD